MRGKVIGVSMRNKREISRSVRVEPESGLDEEGVTPVDRDRHFSVCCAGGHRARLRAGECVFRRKNGLSKRSLQGDAAG